MIVAGIALSVVKCIHFMYFYSRYKVNQGVSQYLQDMMIDGGDGKTSLMVNNGGNPQQTGAAD